MKLGEFKHDNLFAGDAEVTTESAKVKVDTIIRKFTVVTRDKEGYIAELTKAGPDEGTDIYGIALEDASPVDQDGETVVGLTGEYNQNTIIFPEETTYEDYKTELRKIGIFLKDTVRA